LRIIGAAASSPLDSVSGLGHMSGISFYRIEPAPAVTVTANCIGVACGAGRRPYLHPMYADGVHYKRLVTVGYPIDGTGAGICHCVSIGMIPTAGTRGQIQKMSVDNGFSGSDSAWCVAAFKSA